MDQPSATPCPIDRVLIPAAGFGSRLRPLTHAIPKEMLPLGRKPVLEHIVDELRTVGITRLLFVISPGKGMIRDYFGDGSRWGVHCDYVLQPEMKGLGDAILCGEEWVAGKPFAVAFGDCLVDGPGEYPLARLVRTHAEHGAGASVITELVARERTRKYGIVSPAAALSDEPVDPFAMADIVEKPQPEAAPSRLAVAARWVLSADIFHYLRTAAPGADGEVTLTDSVRAYLRAGATAWAVPLRPGEARRDIGGWDTYFIAAVRAALDDPEVGATVRAAIETAKS